MHWILLLLDVFISILLLIMSEHPKYNKYITHKILFIGCLICFIFICIAIKISPYKLF